jgi:hypothetical protein
MKVLDQSANQITVLMSTKEIGTGTNDMGSVPASIETVGFTQVSGRQTQGKVQAQ